MLRTSFSVAFVSKDYLRLYSSMSSENELLEIKVNHVKQQKKWGTVMVPCPVVLVSVGDETEANIITLSWAANVCSKPPRMVIGVRSERHSFGLLKRIGDFVINIPSANHLKAVVLCGTKSGQTVDKFKATGFTKQPSTEITSPMIAECPLNIECKTWKIIELGSHHLFIGDVLNVHIDEPVLTENGKVDLKKMNLFTYNPLVGQYWSLGQKIEPLK
jgi:flavin reductase (DIM6/NTAB) family NADH-FMN oxidoreductase RutF